MVEKNKTEIREFAKTWVPLTIYVATCIWFAATLHARVTNNESTIGKHDTAIHNLDTMIIQQDIRIEHSEGEIERLRNSSP